MHAPPTAIARRLDFIAAAIFLIVQVRAACAAEYVMPQPDHIVVVIFENHSFNEIVDPKRAPFIFSLATGGALFTNSFAVAHPSQPNYFALFSGSTHGIRDNENHMVDGPTLASALEAAHKNFIGFVEAGSPRKHNPWESFTDTQALGRDLDEFPSDFSHLPTVSFIIPNQTNDMHDGSVPDGDAWLKFHLAAYADWTKTHNSLLIVTFDEDDNDAENHIPTIIYGSGVRPGRYDERITHYSVLSTLLGMYGLPFFAKAATSPPIRVIWQK
jgi:phosphatidylinositol-3-phosphatase